MNNDHETGSNQESIEHQGNRAEIEPVSRLDLQVPPDVEDTQIRQPASRRRRVMLPIVLFLATCLSTFFVGTTEWSPPLLGLSVPAGYDPYLSDPAIEFRRSMLHYTDHWTTGLIYMATLLGILFAHEMGHFLTAVYYRIPASLPFFIPIPISPIGTFGAVIGMDGMRADRKELFDIGLAGPLAGLVVAIPVMLYGISTTDLSAPGVGAYELDLPLGTRLLMYWMGTPGFDWSVNINQSQLNPYFMAGWVGLFVTGLNMLPVSQLDGGHVTYTMFGRKAHYLAWATCIAAVLFIVIAQATMWILMLALILLMRPNHPPTRDDGVPIGWFRYVIGGLSLIIPVLCFPIYAIIPLT